ncbi:uncharacterized protein LOC126833415 isoform X2 [Adelges cooleyi]|uniref:uncharacterized protein LOC126833415 isoform X2 n=1 Tax=Adelges cooleyi TaxID=133065 RepID=UPI00217F4F5E|nr:uncharacterized protein LOC126833415 isoform X2 [Adelges cooleyi]
MCEDEWSDIEKRFEKEGMVFNRLKADEKLIHVWRWLVDADINLQNARKMIDKLRQKQNEELEDMENYMVHIRVIADKRIDDMEKTMAVLAEQVARLECELSQLESLDGDNVCDKVSNLIFYYKTLTNEVCILKKFKCVEDNGEGIEKNEKLLEEIIKVSAEKELLEEQVKELENRLNAYSSCDIDKTEDNTHLLSKELSDVLNKPDGKDSLLDNSTSWNKNVTNDDTSSMSIQLFRSQDIKNNQYQSTIDAFRVFDPESTPPSLMSSNIATPRKLSTVLIDATSKNKSEELKQLQADYEMQKALMSSLGEKYNNLALKHLHYKSKRKMQIEALRGNLEASQCQMSSLKTQINIQNHRLKTEEEFRKQVETDYRLLQDEKRNIDFRFAMAEKELRNMARHLSVLQKKVIMLESANADLLSKHLRLVYKEPRLSKSSTCDCITDISKST